MRGSKKGAFLHAYYKKVKCLHIVQHMISVTFIEMSVRGKGGLGGGKTYIGLIDYCLE